MEPSCCAALLVDGRIVAELDEGTPGFRLRGRSAPQGRIPFRHP